MELLKLQESFRFSNILLSTAKDGSKRGDEYNFEVFSFLDNVSKMETFARMKKKVLTFRIVDKAAIGVLDRAGLNKSAPQSNLFPGFSYLFELSFHVLLLQPFIQFCDDDLILGFQKTINNYLWFFSITFSTYTD